MSLITRSIVILAVGAGLFGVYTYRQGLLNRTDRIHAHIRMDRIPTDKPIVPIAVIGSGPAGLSAGLYGARLGIHTVVFQGAQPGGQLMSTSDVENWPGMGTQRGPTIMGGLEKQAAHCGAILVHDVVTKLDTTTWPYTLTTQGGRQMCALAVIIATGATPKKLGIPGEEAYWGHGVTTCAVCDAPFYKDKSVVVIGGGDSAAEEALQLTAYASKITMLVRGKEMRASHAMQARIKAIPAISIRYEVVPQEIVGRDHQVTGIRVKIASSAEELIPTDGVFLAIGHEPNTKLVSKLGITDYHGYIQLVPHGQKTAVPGLFAAGDVADATYRQAGVASGDGIKAAIDAVRFLGDHGFDAVAPRLKKQFYNPAKQARQPLQELSTMEQALKLIASKKAVLIDCYTQFCPSCKTMLPELEAVAAQYGDAITIVKVDGMQLAELMKKYSITTVPTLLLFASGSLLSRHVGALKEAEIVQFITPALDKARA